MSRFDKYSAVGTMILLARHWAVKVWFDKHDDSIEIYEIELIGIYQESNDLKTGDYASFNHSVLLDYTELSFQEQEDAFEITQFYTGEYNG